MKMEKRTVSNQKQRVNVQVQNDKNQITDRQPILYKEAFEMEVLIKEEANSRIDVGSEYEMDCTAGDLYDALHEKIALARTRALMGEWCQAQSLFEEAREEYTMYRAVLQGLPLHALDHAFTETMQILSAERNANSEPLAELTTSEIVDTQKPRTRKRGSRAA